MLYISNVNVKDSDLNLLRVFDAIAVQQSVTPVGETLGLTQPAMSQVLFREPYLCVMRAGHPRAARPLARRDLAGLEFVIVAPAETAHRNVDSALQRLGLASRVMVRMPHFMAIPGILEHSDLVAIVPAMLAELFCRDARLVKQAFPAALAAVEIRIFWHQRVAQDAANRWLRDLVIELHGKAT